MAMVILLFSLVLTQRLHLARTEHSEEISGCGKTYLHGWKMVEGRKVSYNQIPWNVALTVNGSVGTQVLCEGSLVNERLILTRASCLHRREINSITARLGAQAREADAEEYKPEYYGIRSKLVHESYDPTELWGDHDIALLELSTAVVFKKHIAPVCLPENSTNFRGMTVTATRIERPFEKGSLVFSPLDRINITDNNFSCSDFVRFENFEARRGFFENYLCARLEADTARTPLGPILFEEDGHAQLVGFRSSAVRCSKQTCFAAYTNISNDTDWITTRMQPGFDLFNPRIKKLRDTYDKDFFVAVGGTTVVLCLFAMIVASRL